MEEKNNVNLKLLGIGIGVGLLIGGIAGILFAPMKGDILRAEIVKKVRDVKGKFVKSPVDGVHKK